MVLKYLHDFGKVTNPQELKVDSLEQLLNNKPKLIKE